MSTKIKVGLAGFGLVGERRYGVLKNHPNFEVVAIADKKFTDGRSIDNHIRTFQNFQELSNIELDALFVALPNDDAPDASVMGLENSCHVFCEKPPGRSVQDIRRVATAAAERPNLKVKYGFNHRYHDSVKEALRVIQSGELGQVVNMRGVYGKSEFIPWPRPSNAALNYSGSKYWRTNREIAGGGILLDQGIHMVDLMRTFAGEFVDVKSFICNNYWKHDVEDNAYAIMRTAEGTVAMLHSTATQWQHSFSLEIHLQNGALHLSGILSSSRSYGDERLTIVYRDEFARGSPRETSSKYIADNSWSEEINDFALDILENRLVKRGSIDDAIKTMDLVFQIYAADEDWKKRYKIVV